MAKQVVSAKDAKQAKKEAVDNRLLPEKAQFFRTMRSSAFQHAGSVEFWVAMQSGGDKWHLAQYSLENVDENSTEIRDTMLETKALNSDLGFVEAVTRLANFERMGQDSLMGYAPFTFSPEKLPPEKNQFLAKYFYDVEYFAMAARIEGLTFDAETGMPHRAIEGRVIVQEPAKFRISDIETTMTAVDDNRSHPAVAPVIENGILAELFNSVSGRGGALEEALKMHQVLSSLDGFAREMGAFYLLMQDLAGVPSDGFAKVGGLTPDQRNLVYTAAAERAAECIYPSDIFVPAMEKLQEISALGGHTEPFEKHLSECEVYYFLLNAHRALNNLETTMASLSGKGGADQVALIRQYTDTAKEKFLKLGGTEEQMDRLYRWVSEPKQDLLPKWLPAFLTRYYTARGHKMQQVQQRKAGLQDMQVLTAKVKPPAA